MSTNDEVITPTVVIGLGEAGVRMLSAFDDVVEEEGIDRNRILQLAIDTKRTDIEKAYGSISDNQEFYLEAPPDNRWKKMAKEFAYLEKGDQPASQGGVTRQRPLARAHIDDEERYNHFKDFLESNIESFASTRDEVNIVLLNSLGGGTGSGSFILTGALLHTVTNSINTRDSVGFEIAGIGSLPRLDNLLDSVDWPEASDRHIINSYFALKELKTVVEHDYTDPLGISLESDPSGSRVEVLELDKSMFEKYFLFPTYPNEIENSQKRERVNRTVANLIMYISTTTGIEDFPDSNNRLSDQTLFSIDAAELSFPTQKVKRYLGIDDDLTELKKRINTLETTQSDYEEIKTYLQSTLDVRRGEFPPEESPIQKRVVRGCQSHAENVFSSGIEITSVNVIDEQREKAIDTVRAEISGLIDRFDVDDEERPIPSIHGNESEDIEHVINPIAEYFYYDQLTSEIEKQRRELEYAVLVNELWSTYRTDVMGQTSEERFNQLEEADETEKAEGLEKYLDWKISELNDNSGLLGGVFGGNGEEVENLEDDLSELQSRRNRSEKLDNLYAEADDGRDRVQNCIQTLREEFENAIEDLDSEISNCENRRDGLRDQRRSLKNRNQPTLTRFNGSSPWTEFALTNPDRLGHETIKEAETDGIDVIASSGITTRDTIEDNINRVFNRQISDRLADQKIDSPEGMLAVLRHDVNDTFDAHIRNSIDTNIFAFNTLLNPIPISDRLTLRFLAIFTDFDLEETSEFGAIEKHRQEGGRIVNLVIPEGGGREEVESRYVRYAYPELASANAQREFREKRSLQELQEKMS